MRKYGDYIEKFANNIEDKLNMSASDIRNLTPSQFRNILKHKYFRQKQYTYAQSEPTNRQMEALNDHYGITIAPERIERKKREKEIIYKKEKRLIPFTLETIPAKGNYYNIKYGTTVRRYVKTVRRNKIGRWINSETGRFVRVK